ncbi:carbonate dehydratase [Cellulomonas pakistanensis]|uniref:Carbonate dehydratase n=1 Tax=Cellulomonas pakistanensis TaxID=992287 RepID=A0A919P8D1_9CELL|nr:carbonate dehydratase [Cellulomonas pakistanensis]
MTTSALTTPSPAGPDAAGTGPGARPYAEAPAEVLAALGSAPGGLHDAEAGRRLAEHGPNRLPAPQRQSWLRRLLGHFDDILIYILLASAVLKAVLGDWVDFAVILAVAVINAAVGFLQEGQAEKALDGIRTMLSLDAQVRRDGEWQQVDAETLVPGDVVRVRSGDRVPADVRLLEATNLQVEEAALTGESVPSAKQVEAVGSDAGVGDRASMLFSSTIVSAGTGVGVVTATGAGTEIGRIQSLIAEVDHLETPLSRKLAAFGKALSLGILAMAALMLVIGRVIHQWDVPDLISAAIGFAVAAVPEGLPALVTVTLALGVQQMARRNAITRKLTAVEALGAVTTICSDKTGTLTKNEMTTRTVVTAAGTYDVEGLGYAPEGRVVRDGRRAPLETHPDLAALLVAAASANDARVVQDGGQWRVVGQPTEGAITTLALKAGADVREVERLAALPFESATKYMATLDRVPGAGTRIHVVGAPDRLLERCSHQRAADGSTVPLDLARWEAVIDELAGQGLRTLAAAERPVADGTTALDADDVEGGLVFLGLFGIVDPPRPEAVQAIADCHRAGIRVKMITGDHVGTATAIARELGIAPAGGDVQALTGAELEAMSQEQLRSRVREVDVYARTSPEHKIRIVRALQSHGEVVAMTGDGVNDAPALTRADVGIAMGIKGTEATKEAAEIVLADDNFATIERAVEEGRRIYDNIAKSVVFLLPTNGAQSLVILVAVLFGLTLPLSPVQILWVNLVTAVTLSLALAYEPAEPGVMSRPPRAPGGSVISRRSLVHVVIVSLLIGGATLAVFFIERARGTDYDVAQTTAVTMLALGQLAYLFNCRFLGESSLTLRVLRGNRVVWIAAGVLLVLQLVFTYVPFMHSWFDSAPIGPREWALTLGFAVLVFLLAEAMKAITRTLDARRAAGRVPASATATPGEGVGAVPVAGAVTLDDAAARLPELVRAVEHGDEVTLTRDGRPVARIVAAAGAARRTSGRGTAAGATVAANASTTAIQLTPPAEPGAAAGDAGGSDAAPDTASVPSAAVPSDESSLDPSAASAAPSDESSAASSLAAPAAPDPAAAQPAVPPAPEPPTAPTRVSTRATEPEPAPAAADATIVLDPVPAAGTAPAPGPASSAADLAAEAPERPAPPRRRSRREAAAPTEPLGTVDREDG